MQSVFVNADTDVSQVHPTPSAASSASHPFPALVASDFLSWNKDWPEQKLESLVRVLCHAPSPGSADAASPTGSDRAHSISLPSLIPGPTTLLQWPAAR